MQNNEFVVLDIGSGKLRLAELEYEEGNLEVEGYQEVEYAGFTDGAFIEDDLKSACEKLFADVDTENSPTVYVGVPSEFCGQLVKELKTTCAYPCQEDDMYRTMIKYASSEAIVNTITQGMVTDVNVLEVSASEALEGEDVCDILGRVSYIYADQDFINKVSSVIQSLGFNVIEFSSSVNVQSMQMVDEVSKQVGAVLIDVGYLTTSVAIVKGNGIESLKSFSLGGAHLSAELSESLNLPYKVADKLKKKALLTVDPSEVDYYVVSVDDKEYEVEASKVNKVIKSKIEHFAIMIAKCLAEDEYAYHFIMTGGGLVGMKGALDVLSSRLGVVVKAGNCEINDLNKPEQSAIVCLIKQVGHIIRNSQSELPLWKKWWEKIKSWFDF